MWSLDLFSGIGGFAKGFEDAGIGTSAFCELEPRCQRVLSAHYPLTPCYKDIRTLTYERLKADSVNPFTIVTAGFPCQDISVGGLQKGIGDGTRSGLYREVVRLCGDIRPRHILLENVTALLTLERGAVFNRILGDFQQIGYDAWWEVIPARAVGLPHERGRVWIYLYPHGCDAFGIRESVRKSLDAKERKTKKTIEEWQRRLYELVTRNVASRAYSYAEALRVLDGIPDSVDRLKSLGNSICPEIAEIYGKAIISN